MRPVTRSELTPFPLPQSPISRWALLLAYPPKTTELDLKGKSVPPEPFFFFLNPSSPSQQLVSPPGGRVHGGGEDEVSTVLDEKSSSVANCEELARVFLSEGLAFETDFETDFGTSYHHYD